MTNHEIAPEEENLIFIQQPIGLAIFGNFNKIYDWLKENNFVEDAIEIDVENLGRLIGGAAELAAIAEKAGVPLGNAGVFLRVAQGQEVEVAQMLQNAINIIYVAGGQIIKYVKSVDAAALVQALNQAAKNGVDVAGNMVEAAGYVGVRLGAITITALPALMLIYAAKQGADKFARSLESIDKKIELVIRDQKDQAVASILSDRDAVQKAAVSFQETGAVLKTSWSSIANSGRGVGASIHYALTKIDGHSHDIRQNIESMPGLRDATKRAKDELEVWFAILLNAFYIEEQLLSLEMNRVFQESPESVEGHFKANEQLFASQIENVQSAFLELSDLLEPSWENARAWQVLKPAETEEIYDNLLEINEHLNRFASATGAEQNDWSSRHKRNWGEAFGAMFVDAGRDVKEAADAAAARVQGHVDDFVRDPLGSTKGFAGDTVKNAQNLMKNLPFNR